MQPTGLNESGNLSASIKGTITPNDYFEPDHEDLRRLYPGRLIFREIILISKHYAKKISGFKMVIFTGVHALIPFFVNLGDSTSNAIEGESSFSRYS